MPSIIIRELLNSTSVSILRPLSRQFLRESSTLTITLQIKYITRTNLIIKGKVKPKQLAALIKDIPTVLKAQPKELGEKKYEVRSLSDLKEGANPGIILPCKITNVLSQKGEVPAYELVSFLSLENSSSLIRRDCLQHFQSIIVTMIYTSRPRKRLMCLLWIQN